MNSSFLSSFTFCLLTLKCARCFVGGFVFDTSYYLSVIQLNKSESKKEGILVERYDLKISSFGGDTISDNQFICAYQVEPKDGCQPQLSPPPSVKPYLCQNVPSYGFISRGSCSFVNKAKNAQNANYSGVFFYNYKDEGIIQPGGVDSSIRIPSFMISYEDAMEIERNFHPSNGYLLVIQKWGGVNLGRYLLPFVIILGVCFLIMGIAVVVRYIRNRRRESRRRLSKRHLRKIPTKKFRKGEEPDVCPICLDDFNEGDKVRLLLCKHVYHCDCIDPWLLKNRKTCPVCKRKVFRTGDSSSESESETTGGRGDQRPLIDHRAQLGDGEESDDEPLLAVGNSRFYASHSLVNLNENELGQGSSGSSPAQITPITSLTIQPGFVTRHSHHQVCPQRSISLDASLPSSTESSSSPDTPPLTKRWMGYFSKLFGRSSENVTPVAEIGGVPPASVPCASVSSPEGPGASSRLSKTRGVNEPTTAGYDNPSYNVTNEEGFVAPRRAHRKRHPATGAIATNPSHRPPVGDLFSPDEVFQGMRRSDDVRGVTRVPHRETVNEDNPGVSQKRKRVKKHGPPVATGIPRSAPAVMTEDDPRRSSDASIEAIEDTDDDDDDLLSLEDLQGAEFALESGGPYPEPTTGGRGL